MMADERKSRRRRGKGKEDERKREQEGKEKKKVETNLGRRNRTGGRRKGGKWQGQRGRPRTRTKPVQSRQAPRGHGYPSEAKLGAVLFLLGYHGLASWTRKKFLQGNYVFSETACRWINEVPTILLLIIVIAVIVRPGM